MRCKRCGKDLGNDFFDTCYSCMVDGLNSLVNERRADLGLPPISEGEFSTAKVIDLGGYDHPNLKRPVEVRVLEPVVTPRKRRINHDVSWA